VGAQIEFIMSRKKMVILPKLNDCGGDLSKKWFVYYSVRDPRTDKMERFKIFTGLFKEKTKSKRYEVAQEIINDFTEKLKAGWTPFDADKSGVIYEDELAYAAVAEVYQKKRAGNTTIHFYASKLISSVKNEIDAESLRNYKSVLRKFLSWAQGLGFDENDIMFFQREIMINFFNFLIEDLKRSARTVRRYNNFLHRMFQLAVEDKKIPINPVFDMPRTKRINDHTPRPIKDDDVAKFFLELKKHPQLYLAALLQMYCFIRPGNELRNLKINDIDWGRRTINVQREFSKVRKERRVSVPAFLVTILRDNYKLHECNRDFYIFSHNNEPGPTRLGKNNLRMKFNQVRTKLKMPDSYKFYSWKHTGGVMAVDLNIPLSDIQAQMGHESIATTLEYLKNHGAFRNNRFDQMTDKFHLTS
jgi:integrase